MFRGGGQGQWRQWLQGIIQKFREKGAISPEKAMTVQELDLPPRFEQAMHRRLGQTGIFVELNGKYYLNEDRLKQIQERRSKMGPGGGGSGGGGEPGWMRYGGLLLMAPIGIIVVVILFFLFYSGVVSSFPGELLIIALIVLIVLFVADCLFWQSRRRYWQGRWQNQTP